MTQPSVHQLYKCLERVGKGSYGSVYKGVHLPTGNVVALKIIDLDTEDDDVAAIQSEVAFLTQLRDGPNITQYYGCYLDGPRVWIAMELAQGGSILSLMKASPNGCLEEKYVVVVSREVLDALRFLHKNNTIHRDLKAANVLVSGTGKVMLCDFGVSAVLSTSSSKRNTFIGTPYWMAPEVAKAATHSSYDTKADIWSVGIMLYEMIKGAPPNSHIMPEKVVQLIPTMKPPRLAEGEASKELREFSLLCLNEVPSERLTAEDLLKHKWITKSAKVPTTILKDLILRYDAWAKTGDGSAVDPQEPFPWEQCVFA
ncbi:Pkinase-domain-containing protein [Auriscalpium vulgare]|uniref:Pkinase-domain-containing protein n=1 Tax=Auriscalpium vulgare TaxID=40419 RepID=A0ACB8S640_9AGAM|nr:Pkinase-domain-containing protein [Auriscalpium vulgare]